MRGRVVSHDQHSSLRNETLDSCRFPNVVFCRHETSRPGCTCNLPFRCTDSYLVEKSERRVTVVFELERHEAVFPCVFLSR